MSDTNMRGAITFKASGEERTIRFTTNAMCRYQEEKGETLMQAVDALQKKPDDFPRLRRLFSVGVPGLSEEEAGDLMDDIGIMEATKLIGRAFDAAFPAPEPASADASGNGKGKPAKGVEAKAS